MTKLQSVVKPEERRRTAHMRPNARRGNLPRNHRITTAVTEEDEALFRQAATNAGMKLSDWTRQTLLEAIAASENASRDVESGDNASK